jgi:hypothetical protein
MQSDEIDLDSDKGALILTLINSFINSYAEKIEGKFVREITIEC